MSTALIEQQALTDELRRHCQAYYRDDNPTLTDAWYDVLFQKLQAMEAASGVVLPGSPTQTVGGATLEFFQEFKHPTPLLSLDNVFNVEELLKWIQSVTDSGDGVSNDYVVEPKLDGLAVELVYVKGVLQTAATRGDGVTGEDVTANAKTIWNLPQTLNTTTPPDIYEIRGEVVLSRKRLQALNEKRVERNEKPFATCRNAAAGSLRQLDPKLTASRGLAFYAYQVAQGGSRRDHLSDMEEAKDYGFEVALDVSTIDLRDRMAWHDVQDVLDSWLVARKEAAYDTDGLVFKVNDYVSQEALGFTGRSPRWAVAYKFPPNQVKTKLLSVDFQVGRTGAVTPVANLEPVCIDGVWVARATIHNADELNRLGLRYNDELLIHRAGEVIPQILQRITNPNQAEHGELVMFPANCPECGSPLERLAGEVVTYCPNASGCPAQQLALLYHFASRKAMDLQGFGEKTIEALYNDGFLSSPADFFTLFDDGNEALVEMPGLGKGALSLLQRGVKAVQDTRLELGRFLYALGIHDVGWSTARDFGRWIVQNDRFESLFQLNGFKASELLEIPDIGPVTAQSIERYFSHAENIELLQQLRNYLTFSLTKAEAMPLNNVSFAITGTIPQVDRETLKAHLESLGARVTNSVSSNTNYLIAGEGGGRKQRDALALGVTILTGEELFKQPWWKF